MTIPKVNKSKVAKQEDRVMTPIYVAKMILNHFNPTGFILEPAAGDNSFYKQMNEPKDWCEIDRGRDFFNYNKKVDWIITNPPFSIYDDFLIKSFELADNIVFLCPLNKTFKSNKIIKEIDKYGGLKEIIMLGSGSKIGFNFGFQVGCLYYQRDYKENLIKLTKMY